jgi:hypothetical protein
VPPPDSGEEDSVGDAASVGALLVVGADVGSDEAVEVGPLAGSEAGSVWVGSADSVGRGVFEGSAELVGPTESEGSSGDRDGLLVGVGRSRVGENVAVMLGRSMAPLLPAPPQAVRNEARTRQSSTDRELRRSIRWPR